MRRAALVLLTALAISASPAAFAQNGDPAPSSPVPSTPAPGNAPNMSTPGNRNLSCIANGQSYVLGEIACVPSCHGRQRLARCDALAETTADWTTISDTCPSARMTPLPPGNPAHPTVLICTLMTDAPFAQVQ